MSNLSVFTFAVTQADIALYNAGAAVGTWTNIPIVAESSVEYTVQRVEVPDGEGKLQAVWFHTQRAKVNLRVKRFAFRVLEMLTGSPVSSLAGAESINFGVDQELNPPLVRLRLQQKALDANGNAGYLQVIIYKAQGMGPGIAMREVTPGEFQVSFDALQSTKDELGATIASALYRVSALHAALSA